MARPAEQALSECELNDPTPPAPRYIPAPLFLTSSAGVHGAADPGAHRGKTAHCEVGHISGLGKGQEVNWLAGPG